MPIVILNQSLSPNINLNLMSSGFIWNDSNFIGGVFNNVENFLWNDFVVVEFNFNKNQSLLIEDSLNNWQDNESLDLFNLMIFSNFNSFPIYAQKIKWITSIMSDSQVKYGTTTSLGNLTILDTNLMLNHSVILFNLILNKKYYYQCYSKDNLGNLGISVINTFHT